MNIIIQVKLMWNHEWLGFGLRAFDISSWHSGVTSRI